MFICGILPWRGLPALNSVFGSLPMLHVLLRCAVMKKTVAALFLVSLCFAIPCHGEEKEEPDEVENALRQVYATYKAGDKQEVLSQLRALVRLVEGKAAEAVGELLPAEVDDWKGESMKREDLTFAGGGISIARTYVSGERQITVKVIKDAPVLKPMIELLGNKNLLALGTRETHRISGETAVMEGERKLQMVLDQRIYVELVANEGADGKDLVSLARKLDLRALAKLE